MRDVFQLEVGLEGWIPVGGRLEGWVPVEGRFERWIQVRHTYIEG